MTTLIGDLQSIMGTPFGGEGHAVLIFSRVSRAAFQSGAVIIELHDRIPMPKEAEGKFSVEGLDPGPIRVELEGGTVHGHGWNVDLPEEGEWSLADLLDAQVEWSPAVVGRAESAARDAAYAQRQTEGLRAEVQGLRDETFDKADAALNDAANLVRGEFESLTDRAEAGASTATEQAGLAGEHRQKAEDAEDSAHAAAGAAAEATKTEIRAEMDAKVSEAEQSAQSSGESAAASATSAGESATSAQEAGQSAQAAGQHLQDTRDLKAGIDAWWLDELLPTVDVVAGYSAATADDRRQTGEDRTATGGHLTEVERLHGEAEQARDDAQEAAANAQLGAPPGGWQREDMHVDVREDLSRARSALQDVPDATGEARGVIRLAGDLGGSATSPTVPGLSNKSDVGHGHEVDDVDGLGTALAGAGKTAEWSQVSGKPTTVPPEGHRHTTGQIDGLDALIDQRAGALVREAPKMHVWDGEGTWVAPAGAGPNDTVLNLSSGEIHSVEDING